MTIFTSGTVPVLPKLGVVGNVLQAPTTFKTTEKFVNIISSTIVRRLVTTYPLLIILYFFHGSNREYTAILLTMQLGFACPRPTARGSGVLAISQYSEGPATGHLDTGFSWFPCV